MEEGEGVAVLDGVDVMVEDALRVNVPEGVSLWEGVWERPARGVGVGVLVGVEDKFLSGARLMTMAPRQ